MEAAICYSLLNVCLGRGAGRQLTGLNGRYLMSYPPFKHIDFWKPLQPLVADCTHWDFKPERQLYDGEGAVQLNTDHRSGSLPSCLMTPRPTKERICVIAMAFNCVNRSGAESP